MRLESLHLENYRLFEKFDIDFDENLTVLIGANGVGKSTVLEACMIALGTFLYRIDAADSPSITKKDARVVCLEQGSVIDRQSQFPVVVRASGSVLGNEAAWTRSLDREQGRTRVSESREVLALSEEAQSRVREGDASLVLPIIAHYGTDRLWGDASKRSNDVASFSRTEGYRGCLVAKARESRMLNWLRKMTFSELQNGRVSPELDAVKRAVQLCFESASRCSAASVFFNVETQEIDVVLRDGDVLREKMPLSSMSDGYRNTLGMIADIAYRMAVLNPALSGDVLSAPGVVLIDEIDLHLHPLWQAKVLGDLRSIFPNVQFIVTTHAPAVISSVGRQHIRIVGREGAFAPPSETYGRRSDDILQEIMGAQNRPEKVIDRFSQFYDMLDQSEFDGADRMLDEIEGLVGSSDPDLTAARTALFIERV